MSTFGDMVEFLDLAWCARGEIVPCLIGPVGIGKTDAVLKHIENVGAKRMVKIIASQILPNEVSGITMPDSETKAMEIYDHFRLSELEDGDVLFFDELLEADQLVLSACLTLIENRELMSGRKLPDIQIVAAANPTISASQLKENIRQRFLFRRFDIDAYGCYEYIKKKYGISILGLTRKLESTSNNYNILSQRSLTKMVDWMMSSPPEKREDVANVIDITWGIPVGRDILKAIKSKYQSPEAQVESVIRDWIKGKASESMTNVRTYLSAAVDESREYNDFIASSNLADDMSEAIETGSFADIDFTEMIKLLSDLPEWKDLEGKLADIEIEDTSDEEDDIVAF